MEYKQLRWVAVWQCMACLSNLNTLNPPELIGFYTQNIVHMDPYGRHMLVSSSSSFHLAMPNIYNLRRRWKLDEIGNLCMQSMIDQYHLCSLYIMFGVLEKRTSSMDISYCRGRRAAITVREGTEAGNNMKQPFFFCLNMCKPWMNYPPVI